MTSEGMIQIYVSTAFHLLSLEIQTPHLLSEKHGYQDYYRL